MWKHSILLHLLSIRIWERERGDLPHVTRAHVFPGLFDFELQRRIVLARDRKGYRRRPLFSISIFCLRLLFLHYLKSYLLLSVAQERERVEKSFRTVLLQARKYPQLQFGTGSKKTNTAAVDVSSSLVEHGSMTRIDKRMISTVSWWPSWWSSINDHRWFMWDHMSASQSSTCHGTHLQGWLSVHHHNKDGTI